MIVSALMSAPPVGRARWTMPVLAHATKMGIQRARDGVSRLRHAGKIDFKNLALSPSMLVGLPPVLPESIDSASPAGAIHLPPDAVPAGDNLKAQVQAEADVTGRNRKLARSTGTVLSASKIAPPPTDVSDWRDTFSRDHAHSPRALIPVEAVRAGGQRMPAPSDAIRHCQSEMPLLWARCVALAPELGLLLGEAMMRAIGAGLDCLEEAE